MKQAATNPGRTTESTEATEKNSSSHVEQDEEQSAAAELSTRRDAAMDRMAQEGSFTARRLSPEQWAEYEADFRARHGPR